MKLLTNVPPGDGGEVCWASQKLPSNTNEVRRQVIWQQFLFYTVSHPDDDAQAAVALCFAARRSLLNFDQQKGAPLFGNALLEASCVCCRAGSMGRAAEQGR